MDNKDTDAKSQATSAPTAFLVDLVSNRKIPITTPRCRVGRDDLNDIVITGDQSISRFHFIINKEESQYSVQDAKSRHGTFLNGNQITGPEPINDGDVLKIGVSLFWFVIETPATAEGDTPSKGEPEKAKIVLNPSETGVTANGATQDINQLEIIDKLTSLTEAAEAKSDEKDEADAKAEEAAKEEAAKKEAAEKEAAEKEAAEKEAAEKEAAEKEAAEKIAAEKEAAEKIAAEKEAAEKEAAEKEAAEKEAAEKIAAEKEAAEKEAAEKEAAEKEAAEKEAAEKIAAEKEAEEKAKAKKEQEETSAKPDRKNKKGDKGKEDKEDEKSDEPEVSVKDLLDPLHDEIAALREKDQELIKEALEKADYNSESKDETESEKESEAVSAKDSEDEAEKESEKEDEKELVTAEEQQEESQDNKDSDEEKSEDEAVLSEKSSQHDTLDRFADIIESSDSGKNAEESKSSSADSHEEEREMSELTAHDSSHISSSTRNGAEEMTIQGPSTVPDWCKRYFADELKGLNKELDELNDQIRKYQDKIKDIEGQASLTKGIRNTLLVSEGDELIDACKKVLGLIGWNVTQSEEDKNELLLEGDDQKVTIARIIWTNTNAERSHLGQLSISQTRYWCEKGKEPKGVLIVSKVSDKAPTSLAEESDEDFTDFASKKNVCLMSTLQLLSLYRESALKNGKNDELREAIYDSKGWLKGYKLEPGDNVAEEPAGKSLSSLLSS
ncbi:MAG: FHA domain-containing protein [Candidatus Melainabacteria bacterium]|nr:MAG: FHA domain-containing protein [Candidatus Melainabacteria bacterium]